MAERSAEEDEESFVMVDPELFGDVREDARWRELMGFPPVGSPSYGR